jgi:Cdc6-like AAA superfamily ATPase
MRDSKDDLETIVTGLRLERLPKRSKTDLLHRAQKLGWVRAHWGSKKNVLIMARAARDLRDDGRIEGAVELDMVWHRLSAWAKYRYDEGETVS